MTFLLINNGEDKCCPGVDVSHMEKTLHFVERQVVHRPTCECLGASEGQILHSYGFTIAALSYIIGPHFMPSGAFLDL